jgi:threonine synthase
MDPHTAVAADAVKNLKNSLKGKTIILSTAHPAKFPLALKNAGLSINNIPNKLTEVLDKNEVAKKLNIKDNSIFRFIKEKNL